MDNNKMIDDETYQEILEKGLIIDHFFLMCNLKNGIKPVANKRIQGFINLLTKKEYIKDDVLTEKGMELVQNCEFSGIIPVEKGKPEITYATWVVELHKHCQDKLLALSGARQVRDKIEKKAYSFLPNATDLGKVLHKAITLYRLKDYDRIEATIMKYIEHCASANNWFPVLGYYIMKNGASQLATDMEEEIAPTRKNSHKLI